ncbi:hypothetical protein [Halorussus lipolyticus]|uniref:hypothetical protein n=1 Tax=Halorussus lipolyticus TaxID=3034024 RepID=UPI0023E86474|nr:hypothetical protein [Halorussus sp. DT80]
MKTPQPIRSAANEEDDLTIARREYDDESVVVVVDFGRGVEAALDILGDTVIVVAGDRQFEFEVPDDDTEFTTNEGMLVITEEP